MQITGISAPIKMIRTQRKTLAVQIDRDGTVLVRAPQNLSDAKIAVFLHAKADIIQEQVEKRKAVLQEKPFTQMELQQMMEEAQRRIPERVRYYAPLVGVTYGKITIRNQKTRWGSCSSAGNLNFNCLLVRTPPEVLDSVVVHELCHRKQMNHSKAFYAEVYRVFPKYNQWHRWLKEHGASLIGRMR